MADRTSVGRAALHLLLPVAVVAVLAMLAEWWVAGGSAPMTLPRPSAVLLLLWQDHGELLHQLGVTVLTAAYGFLLALLLALAIAFCVYAAPRIEGSVLTVGAVLSSIPLIAIAPILSVWLGLGIGTRVLITVVICVFPMLVSVVQGLRESRPAEQELFTVMAATPWQRFRLLALPSAMPLLFVGMKISAPLAVLGALIGEWNGAETGLGVLMLNAMFGLQVQRLWATVLVACAVSSLAYAYLCLLERVAGYDRSGGAHSG
ncbi:ABC transporter permease subunit [Xylophilus rhododendri]|uniref:ABC transporter permease subunit n=1 Tax=Xylophilus rhododendri TaxID=2697032 RepID=A0A857J196_9BURK|nr:ABC transporter permease subunit [Xylophilus rhododendri]QHI97650.1 ABC transporter permease subunit [Xylophilus rhododendri]